MFWEDCRATAAESVELLVRPVQTIPTSVIPREENERNNVSALHVYCWFNSIQEVNV